jgi:predicted nucleic acid-binding protein
MQLLGKARSSGGLVICGAVYAELLAYPRMTKEFLEELLQDTHIEVEFNLDDRIWLEAGLQYAEYARRRRATGGGLPKRLLVDFIIGAHALRQADQLLTLDPGRYSQAFPKLSLIP